MPAIDKMQEMIDYCRKQQKLQGMPDAKAVFRIPRYYKRGNKVRLWVLRGPSGDVLSKGTNYCIGSFKADAVIAFLEREISREEKK